MSITILPANVTLDHPEADRPEMQIYTYEQLAEIASREPLTAASLAQEYAQASTIDEASNVGLRIESIHGSLLDEAHQ